MSAMGMAPTWGAGVLTFLQGIQSHPLTLVLTVVTYMGEWYVGAVICVVLLIIPSTRMRVGVPMFATTAVAAVANQVLKRLFAEPRPDTHRLIVESGYSFPSGHAMIGGAFIFMAIYVIQRHVGRRGVKIAATTVLTVFTVAVGVSRLYLGVHWPLDIVGGYGAGFAIFVVMAVLDERFAARLEAPRRGRGRESVSADSHSV